MTLELYSELLGQHTSLDDVVT